MKSSNGTAVDLNGKSKQRPTVGEWQSLLLDSSTVPVTNNHSERLSSEPAIYTVSHRETSSLEETITDEVTGIAIATHEARPTASSSKAHSIVLQGQSTQGRPLTTSLSLSTAALDEVRDIYLRQAQSYCDEKQWKKAYQACQEILKIAPQTAEAYKFLGKILQQQGKTTDSMGFYAKALTLQPHYPEVYSNLGSLYAKKQQWEDAVAYYKKAIEQDPNFAMAYSNLSKVWQRLGDEERAGVCLAAALRIQPDLGSAAEHYQIARSFDRAEDKESAIVFYRQVVEREPNRVEIHQRLADLLEDSGDWQGAAACYRQVLSLNQTARAKVSSAPKQLASTNNRQNNNRSGGQLVSARSEQDPVSTAAKQQSSSPEPVRLSEADRQRIQKLVQASSQRKLLRPIESTDSVQLSQVASDANTFNSGDSASPAANLSPVEQAEQSKKMEDWPRAIRAYQQAIRQSPKSGILYRSLADCYEKNAQPAQAAAAWYRAFVLDPGWPAAEQCFVLGRVLQRQGNAKAAQRCYRQAINAEPGFAQAYRSLSELVRSQGKTEEAEAILQKSPVPIKK